MMTQSKLMSDLVRAAGVIQYAATKGSANYMIVSQDMGDLIGETWERFEQKEKAEARDRKLNYLMGEGVVLQDGRFKIELFKSPNKIVAYKYIYGDLVVEKEWRIIETIIDPTDDEIRNIIKKYKE